MSRSWVDPCTEIDGMFSGTARCGINTHSVMSMHSSGSIFTPTYSSWRYLKEILSWVLFSTPGWTRKTSTKGLKPRNIVEGWAMQYLWGLCFQSCHVSKVMASGCQINWGRNWWATGMHDNWKLERTSTIAFATCHPSYAIAVSRFQKFVLWAMESSRF